MDIEMDKKFTESDYIFDFSKSITAYKADDKGGHDLSAVDFVVETPDNILLIEVKNSDNIRGNDDKRKEFLSGLSQKFYPYKARAKYTDIMLKKFAMGEDFSKPIICIFILEFKDFTKTDRSRLKEQIFNRLPFSLNKKEFGGKKRLERFELLTVDEFKAMFPDFDVTPELLTVKC